MVISPPGEIRPLPPVAHGSRKLVTVLFVDMVDSTALADELDAESSRALMEHYFQAADEVVARHGGTSRSSSGTP
jgi:class 3 adenylate cyclase